MSYTLRHEKWTQLLVQNRIDLRMSYTLRHEKWTILLPVLCICNLKSDQPYSCEIRVMVKMAITHQDILNPISLKWGLLRPHRDESVDYFQIVCT